MAKPDKGHPGKLKNHYTKILRGKVIEEALRPESFFKNYQILRNVSHVDPENGDQLFIVFPKANAGLDHKVKVIDDLLTESMRTCVTVLHLEDLFERITTAPDFQSPLMREHYRQFGGKYFVPP